MSPERDDDFLGRLGEALSSPVPPLDPDRAARVADLAASTLPSPADPSRRRLLWLGAAAAGGVAAGVTGAVLLVDSDAPEGPLTEAVGTLSTPDGVTAEARLIDHTWGMEVMLDVSGLEPGTPYAMTYVDLDEQRTDAGGFVGTAGTVRCRNNGSVLRVDVARFEVSDPAGAVVVRGDLA